MKNILTKFKINNATYLLIFTFLITGYIKNIILILIIVLFHELGHIFFLKKLDYTIDEVIIYPFGGLTKTSKLINTPINQDLLIYSGGVIFQIILSFIFYFLFKLNLITSLTFKLFLNYNFSILLFNLLPIKPLDGGEIMSLLIAKKYPFKKTLDYALFLSGISLFLFLIFNIHYSINNYLIMGYLLVKLNEFIKKKNYLFHKFLLERFLYTLPYQKIEHDELINTKVLKKDTLHFFKKDNRYYHEREILAKKFDRKTYF